MKASGISSPIITCLIKDMTSSSPLGFIPAQPKHTNANKSVEPNLSHYHYGTHMGPHTATHLRPKCLPCKCTDPLGRLISSLGGYLVPAAQALRIRNYGPIFLVKLWYHIPQNDVGHCSGRCTSGQQKSSEAPPIGGSNGGLVVAPPHLVHGKDVGVSKPSGALV